ncbi:MAG TPA: response regulator [Acidobacteriaceae bacterium]|nr:response regulator [Acidobacteriaceae bacterium]
MTTEQNQPQAAAPEAQPPQTGQPHSHQSNGQGQGRRRRRRRKGKSGGAQANGQAAQPGQQQSNQSNGHQGQKQKAQGRYYQKNGNGQQLGNGNGGGRRKNKQKRQQVFVGPMDHSYRAANGNIADTPPSTIELRNGNVRGNGYSGDPLATWEPPPPPVREDAPINIYFFIEDLFFLAKIQETAKKLGIKVGFLKNEKDDLAKLTDVPEDERPSLIVFDLNNANAKPLTLIPKLKTKLKKSTSIVGFLSHLQGDLKGKAVEAGCDMVMPRSAFSQNLPNLMRRHGLKDEQEELEAAPAY